MEASSSGAPDSDTGRRVRIREICAEAVKLASKDRPAFLREACSGDPALRADVEHLLNADETTVSLTFVPATPFPPGKNLAGRFRVVRFIARGGMGDVYEVDDLQLGERAALKTIRPEMVAGGPAVARFKREIQYAKRVTHPNVCRIFDLGSHVEDGVEIVFLTMELLVGETLAARLRSSGPLRTDAALPLIIQMAEALGAAHEAGIIHRDFKPGNVMLTSAGAAPKAVVTDFGLAQSIAGGADDTLTDTGKFAGTPAYMAPEQLIHGAVTQATDIYALGLVVYEMLAGRKPFTANTPLEAAVKRLSEPPAGLEQYVPDLDPRWRTVILRCLEPEPARRFQSARELVRELTSSAPISSQTTGNRRGLRRALTAALVAAALVFLLLAGVWILGRHRPPAAALRWYDQGTRALRDGTPFTAMRSLERAVQIDPDFSLARARLAEAATDLDYMDKAQSEMLRASPALQSFFLPPEEKLRLEAIYFFLIRDFGRAADRYGQLVGKVAREERAGVLVDLGRTYEAGGRFHDAIVSYNDSIGRDNQYAAAFLRRAALEGRQQQNAAASADFDTAEQLFRAEGNSEGITEVVYQRSLLLRRTGRLAEARAPAERALEMARNGGDEYHQIRALLILSYLLYNSGDTDGGQREATEAIDLARRVGIEVLAASGVVDVGNALFSKGDYVSAERYLRSALDAAAHFQAARVEARAELTLGQVLVNEGRTAEGLAVSKRAIAHFEQAGDQGDAARAATSAARLLRDQGEYTASESLFREQLQSAERVKDDGGIALAAQGLGSVLLLQEQYSSALGLFNQSAEVSNRSGDLTTEAYSHVSTADALRSLGRYTQAEEALKQAESLEERLHGNKPLRASLNFSRAQIDLSRLNLVEVEQDVRKMGESAATESQIASQKRLLGLQRIEIGRINEARSLCEKSVEQAMRLNNIPLLRNSELALAEARLASGDRAGALTIASRLASDFATKGQHESELRALSIAIYVSRGDERTRYLETARKSLTAFQQLLGADFAGFVARPDIQKIMQRAGLF